MMGACLMEQNCPLMSFDWSGEIKDQHTTLGSNNGDLIQRVYAELWFLAYYGCASKPIWRYRTANDFPVMKTALLWIGQATQGCAASLQDCAIKNLVVDNLLLRIVAVRPIGTEWRERAATEVWSSDRLWVLPRSQLVRSECSTYPARHPYHRAQSLLNS